MNIKKQILKRINTIRKYKEGEVTEVKITKDEAKELGGIKEIDGVKLIIVSPDKTKKDCYAYTEKER